MDLPSHTKIRRALLRWFRRNAKPLPWRGQPSPYAVWISEIMLQQTQVATVIPYYQRFLREFPSVEALAAAPIERVLELWSGLGYYRRARHLHQAAQKLVTQFGGQFPAEYHPARTLPGIGDYTARAILSIAFERPYAVLDGNVARVIARLFAHQGNLHQPGFWRAAGQRLEHLLSRRHPGDFNQAMMELGQTVCLPKRPRCDACPLRRWCEARRLGQTEAYPSPRPRRPTEVRHLATAIIRPGAKVKGPGRKANITRELQASVPEYRISHFKSRTPRCEVLLVRGLDEGLLGDLWNFPAAFGASRARALLRLREKLVRLASGNADAVGEMAGGRRKREDHAQKSVALATGLPGAGRLEPAALPFARLRHGITYRSIKVDLYTCQAPASLEASPASSWRWFRFDEIDGAAVSQLARKIAATISGATRPG